MLENNSNDASVMGNHELNTQADVVVYCVCET